MDLGFVAIQIFVFGTIILLFLAEKFFKGWEVHPIDLQDEFAGWF